MFKVDVEVRRCVQYVIGHDAGRLLLVRSVCIACACAFFFCIVFCCVVLRGVQCFELTKHRRRLNRAADRIRFSFLVDSVNDDVVDSNGDGDGDARTVQNWKNFPGKFYLSRAILLALLCSLTADWHSLCLVN